jgi:hypothetical protein
LQLLRLIICFRDTIMHRVDNDAGTFTWLAFYPYFSVNGLHDPFDDGQTQAVAVAGLIFLAVFLGKRFEHHLLESLTHTDAVVNDFPMAGHLFRSRYQVITDDQF